MSTTIRLRKMGNSVGLILPKDIADHLHVTAGDVLHVVADGDGARLTRDDPTFEIAMKAFGRTRRKFRNALHQLAK